jgi:hypothetical protein
MIIINNNLTYILQAHDRTTIITTAHYLILVRKNTYASQIYLH